MMLKPCPISSDCFSYHKTNKTFYAEASDFFGPRTLVPERVWDDAADLGFSIVNPRTGRHVVFSGEQIVNDPEGDIAYWEYVCVTPMLRDLKCKIFND